MLSDAISCYECNSYSDKRCLGDQHNKLSDDLKKPCPKRDGKEHMLCRKIKQVIDFEVNGLQPDSRVIRSCGYDDSQYANRCFQRSGFGGRQEGILLVFCRTSELRKYQNNAKY
ncbi:hypothetical protein NQ317_013303 [Molorchus minor]|uniref:Protein quiver n=1 Tax=Molorchus minor TaxID=1323400 RepID=A0ABQ9JHK4_9CUCU|nr:hypothetical protein NQ317_013303 [Molorchus minor]